MPDLNADTADSAATEWRGLGDLVALATERLVLPVEGMHRTIAARWLGLGGSAGAPLADAYDGAIRLVYGTIRGAGRAVGSTLGTVGAHGGNRIRPLWSTSAGKRVQANANALWGDELARRNSSLGIRMGFRTPAGEAAAPGELTASIPAGSKRLAVMIHGLGETERCWDRGNDRNIMQALVADGIVALPIRYNTGRRVSENGTELAALLERVVARWPTELDEIALVGHSMGGLVARSAVHAGLEAGHGWARLTRHVVAIGSPHLGAPLEKGVNLVARALSLVSETRPLGEFIDLRSRGIKDLRFGSIRDGGAGGMDSSEPEYDLGDDISLCGTAEQHFVAGVITRDPSHPIGVAFGDLMVRVASSTGQGPIRSVAASNVRVFGRRRHFDLLGDPDVCDQVRAWLTPQDSPDR